MNSLPSLVNGNMVEARAKRATKMVAFLYFSTLCIAGRYSQIRNLAMGFLCSGFILPLIKSPIKTGTSVTERSAAAATAKVLVYASGLKSLPSWASSVNMGMKETVMIKREKKSAGPTSLAASVIISQCGFFPPSRSMCLCAFSIMTMAPSIITPIAMAIPPRLIMLALRLR